MGSQLDGALLAMGGAVLVLGLVSRVLKHLSLGDSLLAFALGLVLGPGLGLLRPEEWGKTGSLVEHVARATLAVGLMRIALGLPKGWIGRARRSLGAVLAAGMPGMWLATSALVHLVLGLPALESLLVGAILTPTDPVVAASIVTGDVAEESLPEDLRHLLASESGANDGLAFPFVLLPVFLLTRGTGGAIEFALHGVLLGVVVAVALGAALGWGFGRLLVVCEERKLVERPSFLAATLALAFTALGLAGLVGSNGVLAVFVAGVAFDSVVGGRERAEEEAVVEAVDRFFTLPVFLLLGLVAPVRDWIALGGSAVALVVLVLALRRLPLWLALRRAVPGMRARADALFLGWFGPIGVTAMYYGALARERTGLSAPWTIATLLVAASLVVHGLSATPLTRWYDRRARKAAGRAPRPSRRVSIAGRLRA